MKTAISIPDELFASAEAFAKRRGLSRSELFQKAIRTYLERQRPHAVREELDRVYGSEGGKLDASAALAQAEVLSSEDW